MNLSKIQLFFLTLCFAILITVFSATNLHAQEASQYAASNEIEMADLMRSNGKIYVVVAVILSIFAGLVAYTVRIDRKIAKMEKGEEK